MAAPSYQRNYLNKLTGVNTICAGCQNDCKQFEQVTLLACPKYQPSKSVGRK